MPVDELSKNEISVMLAGTTNTIPTLFWYVVHVWLRPELVEQIRREVSETVPELRDSSGAILLTPPDGLKKVTIHFSKLDANCPLLGASYREAVRLASQILTLRRVMSDTVITDNNQGGRSYLLKKGNNVMMPAKVVHRNKETWGDDAEEFNPLRFLPDPDGNKELDKLRRISFVPFGGGKHYCPGRHFAFNENLAFMAALVLGFEVVGLDRERMRMRDSKMGEAAKPVPGFEGGPVVIKRRSGWEDVEWDYAK
jgi:cytochrome P450